MISLLILIAKPTSGDDITTEDELAGGFIKFLKVSFGLCKNRLRRYSSVYSRHDFTQHQLMSLLMLKTRMRLRYREFAGLVSICPKISCVLMLPRIPHYTTLQKFFSRIGSPLLDRLLYVSINLFDISSPWIAVDSTGHSSAYASRHYEHRIHRKRKNYSKNSIAVDTKTQIIFAQKVRIGSRHDSIDADALIRKTKSLNPKGFSLDKGYDCERIHKVIREELGADSQIPVRMGLTKNGKYRMELIFGVNRKKYNRRSMAETVNSVEKRA